MPSRKEAASWDSGITSEVEEVHPRSKLMFRLFIFKDDDLSFARAGHEVTVERVLNLEVLGVGQFRTAVHIPVSESHQGRVENHKTGMGMLLCIASLHKRERTRVRNAPKSRVRLSNDT